MVAGDRSARVVATQHFGGAARNRRQDDGDAAARDDRRSPVAVRRRTQAGAGCAEGPWRSGGGGGTSDGQSLRAGRSAYARLVSRVARRRRTVTHGPPDDGYGTLRGGLLRLDESPGRPPAPSPGGTCQSRYRP